MLVGEMATDLIEAKQHAHELIDQLGPGQIKADFTQSTFFGVPLSPAQLRRQAADHFPILNEDGQIDRQILALMDGTRSLGDLARRIQDLFPDRFPSRREALTRVGELSGRYGRRSIGSGSDCV